MNRLVRHLIGIFVAAVCCFRARLRAPARRVIAGALGVVVVVAMPARAVAGTCRMEILVDRSGSMTTPRTDGVLLNDGTTPTRCYAAGLVVQQLLQAQLQGDAYDIKKINDSGIVVAPDPPANIPPDVYDTTCPNLSDRKVSIRVFKSVVITNVSVTGVFDQVTQTPDFPSSDGFLPVGDAFKAWKASPYWDKVKKAPAECNVQDLTPLAQAMCITAGDFPAGLPAPGNLRQAMFLTDGGENVSQLPGCRDANVDPVDPGVQGSGGWGDRVTATLLARGVEGHGFLFTEGAQGLAARAATQPVEPFAAQFFPARKAAALAVTTTDQTFFQTLANQTHGSLTVMPDNVRIAPTSNTASTTDTDGDGVPDFRDFCPFGMCSDLDDDQIPDSLDQCAISQVEDGKGPFPADGCSDFDADGIRDGLDLCPTTLEDWYPPKPYDGCPRPPTTGAAAPAAPTMMIVLLGAGMLGLGMLKTRRQQRLV